MFQGRAEYGPRALRNRSMLANPSVPGIQNHMNHNVKVDKRDKIPGVVHVAGSSRTQTVTAETNWRYYDLLQKLKAKTGLSMV
ncbi:hypothetical protein E8L90_06260 [Brevibacillus antibioticus]|uniref:Carbamoyltransferase C-terminal domain-containing protein n=1 Tax=Brevibacillus antibioticus TaxID=2570228 RepID=A0A4U2Y5R6_9BACL|nr:carbamoyltransferase C-terminal domain-containing protein [Brevibacillus antibioticus]TKI55092.1 hypothetical protein E8L90_06260 [Brevibacillus antibioticus]